MKSPWLINQICECKGVSQCLTRSLLLDTNQETAYPVRTSKAPTSPHGGCFPARVIQSMDLHIKRLYIQIDSGRGWKGCPCEDVWKELCCRAALSEGRTSEFSSDLGSLLQSGSQRAGRSWSEERPDGPDGQGCIPCLNTTHATHKQIYLYY